MIKLTKKALLLLDKSKRVKVIILFFIMIVGGILESFGVSLVLPLVESINNSYDLNNSWYSKLICKIFNIYDIKTYIKVLILLLIIIYLVKNIYLLIEKYIQNSFISHCKLRTQKQLLSTYYKLPYEYFLNADFGEILRIMNSDIENSYSLLLSMLTIYMDLISSILVVSVLIFISPLMSLLVMLLLLFEMLLLARLITPIMKNIGREDRKYEAESYKSILILVNGIKDIKVSNNDKYFIEKYNNNIKKANIVEIKNKTITAIPKLFTETVTIVGVLIIVYIQLLNGHELIDIVPILSAFAMAAVKLLPSMSSISQLYNTCKFSEGAIDNVLYMMKNLNDSIKISNDHSDIKIVFEKEIIFNDVEFSYQNTNINILENANFIVKSGESVGIIGASGSGKTTTVDIILGLLKPSKGSVFVDGIDINENIESWLDNLSYIPQNIYLIDDTIRSNVAFGINEEDISDERVWEVLKDAKLDKFVESLPDQLDTRIGERGTRLSGGQGQRIVIARALYKNPKLLIFDEATSALDNETESAIMESINHLKGKVTMIIIAHRLTTIEHCDSIYKVDNRKIIKQK